MSTDPISQPETSSQALPWRPVPAVVYTVAVFLLSQILAGILLSIYPMLRHWSDSHITDWLSNSVPAQFGYVVLAEGISLLLVYAWLHHFRMRFPAIGLNRLRLRYVGYGIMAVPVYYLLFVAATALLTQFLPSLNLDQKQEIGFNHVQGFVPLVLTFISLVVLPPLTEEIMVRGLLYGSLRKGLSFLWATLLTSAIFAAAHLPEGGASGPLWIAALDTFMLSLVLCYTREKTGSLWPGITLHAIKNGIAFTALFIIGVH